MRASSVRRAGKVNLKVVGCVGGGVFLLLCVGCCVGAFFVKREMDTRERQAERKRVLDALEPEVPGYLAMKDLKVEPGKFKGKVVCLDRGTSKIDEDSLIHLPPELVAKSPDEVSAVLLCRWREDEHGTFDDGSKSKVFVVTVTLIDRGAGKMLVPFKEIRGDPPTIKRGSGDRLGARPWDKIASFLKEHAE